MRTQRLIAILLFLQLAAAAAGHEGRHDSPLLDRQYKVGKQGEVNVGADTAIGQIVIRKGKYKITHEASGDQHKFFFSPETKAGSKGEVPATIEVRTKQLLAAREKISGFVLYAVPYPEHDRKRDRPDYRIAKITVNGEHLEHLF